MSEGVPTDAPAADPASDGFNLEDPLGAAGGAASSYEGEYSETVKRLLSNIKRDRTAEEAAQSRASPSPGHASPEAIELTTFSGGAGAEADGAGPRSAAGEKGGAAPAGQDAAGSAQRPSDASPAAAPADGDSNGDADAPATGAGAGPGAASLLPPRAAAAATPPPRAAPPAQPHPDAILVAAAAEAASAEAAAAEAAAAEAAAASPEVTHARAAARPSPPAPSTPTKAAPPAHPHPANFSQSPLKHTQSGVSASAAAALRHPEEELLKPARWDTHSWLPLVPASGLLCHQGHDVLGFQIEPAQRDRLTAWSEGYMETVAQVGSSFRSLLPISRSLLAYNWVSLCIYTYMETVAQVGSC